MAQQTLFSEDFEGAQPAFTLNTTDVGSTASGDNAWLVNNAYTGGTGTYECLGIPFTFSVANTPAQPTAITSTNGKYLHVTSNAAAAGGVVNCNFQAADGLCTNAANHFARMSADVSTLGATDVSFTFWWLCAGSPNSYGEVYYSTDAGTSWTQVSAPFSNYNNQSAWVQQTLSLPAFAGQAALRFGFRFVNGVATAASDPAFGIDDVAITASTDAPALAAGALADASYCPGSTFLVPYTATGAWGPANVFTAELSDANGSFAAPVAIGSLASTASGSIPATIPMGTPLGTAYLVRVTGSDPVGILSTSPTMVTITVAPYAGQDTHISFCSNSAPQALLDFMPGASACGSWTSPGGGAFPDTLLPWTAADGDYSYITDCPGNCPQDTAVLTVGIIEAPNAGVGDSILVCANSAPFVLLDELGGVPDAGGEWTLGGVPSSGIYDPAADDPGCFTYTVAGITPCPNAMAILCVLEDPCTGITEAGTGLEGLHWLGQEGSVQRVALGVERPDAVELLDASGRSLKATTRIDGRTLSMDMARMAPGVYLLRIHSAEGSAVLRFVNR